ncbi:MAG TPA: carbohydrate ABC transporter permease [Caldilineaceae bacterium]|nr:carbohydrate ABC transporter permease [Caldilineaceae bacterium]
MMGYSRVQQSMLFLLVLAGACLTMFPLWWLLVSSFTPENFIFQQSGLWPTQFTLDNYIQGWRGVSGVTFGHYFLNSFVVVGACIIGTLISASMAAYAFARMDFNLKRVFFAIMLGTMMLPFHVTLIPRYIIFYRLGWVDSFLPLTVPSFFATNGFFIFLMVQFMRGIPIELDHAARVDGCSPIQLYLRIILPLTMPALVTTAIFTFIWTWNDFFSQLLYISNPRLYTIALGLRAFQDATSASAFGQMFAMSILSLLPIFIFFIAAQKLLIEGISTTGMKG